MKEIMHQKFWKNQKTDNKKYEIGVTFRENIENSKFRK